MPQPPLPKAGSARTGPLPLHPMTLSDILDGAFKLLKANLKVCLLITALFVVPLNIASAWLQRSSLTTSFSDIINDPSVAESAQTDALGDTASLIGSALAVLISMVVTPFVAGAVSRVVSASYLGEQLSAGPALAATGRRAVALVVAFVVTHLAVIVPAIGYFAGIFMFADNLFDSSELDGTALAVLVVSGLLLLVGGIIQLALMAPFVGIAPAIVVEELGPFAGIKRSWRLMVPRYWAVLGISLLAGLIAAILGAILGTPFSAVAQLVGNENLWPLAALGSILPALITTPFVAIVATLLYFDARIRREGFDLQLSAANLAGGSPVR